MSHNSADNQGALLSIMGDAVDEITIAVAELDETNAEQLLSLCQESMDNIARAAEMVKMPDLMHAAKEMHQQLCGQDVVLTSEQGIEIVSWLSDVLLSLEPEVGKSDEAENDDDITIIPDFDDLKDAGSLDEELSDFDYEQFENILEQDQAIDSDTEIRQITSDVNVVEFPLGSKKGNPDQVESAASDYSEFPFDDFPESDQQDSVDEFSGDKNLSAKLIESDLTFDLDGDHDVPESMLGMLAYEIRDAEPQLKLHASEMILQEADLLNQHVDSYLEIVARIGFVAEEMGLAGLSIICDFVRRNTILTSELTIDQRSNPVKLLQGWPEVVIAHLSDPLDDALCLSVVDYLEIEDWPEPLAYRDVRGLIDGLTTELETSGDFVAEQRETNATADDVALTISSDASMELIDAFFAESPGHAERFSSLVAEIASGNNVLQSTEAAQRIAHTLKGSGNLVGVKGIANLAHHIEDIFEYISKQKIIPPPDLSDTMLEAADTIEAMLDYLQDMAPAPQNSLQVLQNVLNWANKVDAGNLENSTIDSEKPDETGADEMVDELAAPIEVESLDQPTEIIEEKVQTVRVPINVLDDIFRIVSETAVSIGQIQEHLNRLDDGGELVRKNDVSLQQKRYELENLVNVRGMAVRHRNSEGASASDFDPLEMDEYDEFYGAAHSYIEGVADSREILQQVTSEVTLLDSLFLSQQRLNKELQQVVMSTRMVPVGNIAARLQRAVRQACRATGKQAELTLTGDHIELDGEILNKLADPLMHMLRNAVDHSIEESSEREMIGKSVAGQIQLKFLQQGNNVVVECIDDGAGLNYEKIRDKAIERELIAADETVDHPILARMILQSGFSTRTEVTQISGRGVGMDVVYNAIQSLKGVMEVSDNPDGGAIVTLRLPITLLTSHCLLVGIGSNQRFAIPTTTLTQILSPGTGELVEVDDDLIYQLGDEQYSAFLLNSLVDVPVSEDYIMQNSAVLLVRSSDGITAVIVDHVLSSYDLVIKNLGAYIDSISGITGVSMLGNGDVVSVLDIPSLLDAVKDQGWQSKLKQVSSDISDDPRLKQPKVLIVDDSLSVRSSLSQLMSDGGYQFVLARDGLDAINTLEQENPDIVLTDLEMPRMNGLELISYIRNSTNWSKVPVVMITSRTMAKHRKQAEEAGVTQYITKPFSDDDILASIDEQLGQIIS